MKSYLLNKLRKKLKLPKQLDAFLVNNFPFVFFAPHMSDRELCLFEKHTRTGKNVVEYGSGGSTFYFLKRNKKVISIENNESFFLFMKTINVIKRSKHLNFQYVDTGKSLSWGRPENTIKMENWPKYYKIAWEDLHLSFPDIIFIDGRFRVMCALEAINYISLDTIIIIHDFSSREYYYDILNYFEIIDQVDALVILKKKHTIDLVQLAESKSLYKYDYR